MIYYMIHVHHIHHEIVVYVDVHYNVTQFFVLWVIAYHTLVDYFCIHWIMIMFGVQQCSYHVQSRHIDDASGWDTMSFRFNNWSVVSHVTDRWRIRSKEQALPDYCTRGGIVLESFLRIRVFKPFLLSSCLREAVIVKEIVTLFEASGNNNKYP